MKSTQENPSLVVNNRKATKDKRFMKLTQVLFVPREAKKKSRTIKAPPIYPLSKQNLAINPQVLEQAEGAFFDFFNVHYPGLLRKTFDSKTRDSFLVTAVWVWGLRYVEDFETEELTQYLEGQLAQFVHSQFNVVSLDSLHGYRLCYMLSIEGCVPLIALSDLCHAAMECLFYSLPPPENTALLLEYQLLKLSCCFHNQLTNAFAMDTSTLPLELPPSLMTDENHFEIYGQLPNSFSINLHQLSIDHITLATAICFGHLTKIVSKIHQLHVSSDLEQLKHQVRDLLAELNSIYQTNGLVVADIGMNANLTEPTIPYIDYMLSLDFIFETVSLLMVPTLEADSSFWHDFSIEVNTRIVNLALRMDTTPIYHARLIPLTTAINNLTLLESQFYPGKLSQPHQDPLHHIILNVHLGGQLLVKLTSLPGPIGIRAHAALSLLLPASQIMPQPTLNNKSQY